eukprot:scaffold67634_cov30-Attheya_sp.AAC.1
MSRKRANINRKKKEEERERPRRETTMMAAGLWKVASLAPYFLRRMWTMRWVQAQMVTLVGSFWDTIRQPQ